MLAPATTATSRRSSGNILIVSPPLAVQSPIHRVGTCTGPLLTVRRIQRKPAFAWPPTLFMLTRSIEMSMTRRSHQTPLHFGGPDSSLRVDVVLDDGSAFVGPSPSQRCLRKPASAQVEPFAIASTRWSMTSLGSRAEPQTETRRPRTPNIGQKSRFLRRCRGSAEASPPLPLARDRVTAGLTCGGFLSNGLSPK